MVVCGSQPGRHLERPPALAIEVLSTATADKDRTVKRRLYELAGVGHYLLVDPVEKTIEWLELGHDSTFRDRSDETARTDQFSLTLADGCRIDLDRRVTFA
jgi:Uma2 family endonuclease